MRRIILRAAAVLIPFIIVAGFCYELSTRSGMFTRNASFVEFDVPYGERLHIAFQDGSSVYLNSGSHIRYPGNFGFFERRVELEGEGWFDIAKDRRRPFVVDLHEVNVRVSGTAFNVKAYPDEDMIYVSLECGAVDISGSTFNSVSVKPGEEVIYSRLLGNCQIVHPEKKLSPAAWRNSRLIFSDNSLEEVMNTLKRTFDVAFTVEDSTALKYSYTLETDRRDISAILKELEKITPVRFNYDSGTIRVFMKKM